MDTPRADQKQEAPRTGAVERIYFASLVLIAVAFSAMFFAVVVPGV